MYGNYGQKSLLIQLSGFRNLFYFSATMFGSAAVGYKYAVYLLSSVETGSDSQSNTAGTVTAHLSHVSRLIVLSHK